MGIREQLNQNPAITTGVTIGIIVIAVGVIVWQLFGGSAGTSRITESFYTVDDGKTYFADDVNKVPPFTYEGKEAVRCFVYKCADGTPFVGYLERFSKEAKPKYEAAMANVKDPNDGDAMMQAEMFLMEGTEVKKPGDPKWHNRSSPAAEAVINVLCPDGSTKELNIVLP